MPASQFQYYTSTDPSGPGPITGQAGSLLSVLDACLVNGYGSKAAAGWSKPFANSGNIGCYQNGATIPHGMNPATGLSLLINDNGPNGTSTYKEAWAVGWEAIASIGSPVGTGTGQFPLPAQLLSGNVVVRKSFTADTTPRYWELFGDAYTFYFFVQSGDQAGVYFGLFFGDIFSLKGASDAYRCFIHGSYVENSGANGSCQLDAQPPPSGNACALQFPVGGLYMPRTFGGSGTSINVTRIGDFGLVAISSTSSPVAWNGLMQTPNGPDLSLYLTPAWVCEPLLVCKRGRMRGFYQLGHPAANFADGQTFNGANDYAGKTFQIVKGGIWGGLWCIETSATVETN